jgi:steroid 5-alpha reductase family enzyme
MSPRSGNVAVWVLASLWIGHYVERTFHYPLKQRGQSGKRMPATVVLMALIFNVINSYVNSRSLGEFGPDYDLAWLSRPATLLGITLFVFGFGVNRWADARLRELRAGGDPGYKVPRGGLYEYVSCPNYLGEMLEWCGWAIATWSLAGLAFAAFTAANLAPRALANHAWYRREFPDYPENRRALIPFLL